MKEKKLV